MHVVERPVAATETRRTADRLGEIGAGAAHRGERRHALAESDGDCRRKRAAGAMRAARLDARALDDHDLTLADEDVAHDGTRQMSALDQGIAAAKPIQQRARALL